MSISQEIIEFSGPKLDKFFADEVLNLDISQFPDPLQKILGVLQIAGAIAAPRVFREALACKTVIAIVSKINN